MQYLNLIFDAYNQRWKTDGIVGSLTTNPQSGIKCGTFYLVEKKMESKRQSEITTKVKKDGSVRFFRNDAKKSGVSELNCCTESGVSNTITTNGAKVLLKMEKTAEIELKRLGNIYGENVGTGHGGNVWDKNGLCQTIKTMQGGNNQPMVIDEVVINDRGFKEKSPQVSVGVMPTLRAETHGNLPKVVDKVVMDNRVQEIWQSYDDEQRTRYRIRKLTCREVWRLMGFSDEDFEKAQAVNSNSQLYKQAGNSIVKDVLIAIFRNLGL